MKTSAVLPRCRYGNPSEHCPMSGGRSNSPPVRPVVVCLPVYTCCADLLLLYSRHRQADRWQPPPLTSERPHAASKQRNVQHNM